LLKTCCRRRNRCSTRCCRNNLAEITVAYPLRITSGQALARRRLKTYHSSGRACRRRGQSRFARLHPSGAG
jgi:hypothetical protein